MPVKMFKHKQVHWEATFGEGIGRGGSAGKKGVGGGKGGCDANVCTAIEQLCICIWVEGDYTQG